MMGYRACIEQNFGAVNCSDISPSRAQENASPLDQRPIFSSPDQLKSQKEVKTKGSKNVLLFLKIQHENVNKYVERQTGNIHEHFTD